MYATLQIDKSPVGIREKTQRCDGEEHVVELEHTELSHPLSVENSTQNKVLTTSTSTCTRIQLA